MKCNEQSAVVTPKDAPSLIAWYVVECGEKSFWTRISAAWPHADDAQFLINRSAAQRRFSPGLENNLSVFAFGLFPGCRPDRNAR